MALEDDLERIAGLAAEHGEVTGVLAAEPALRLRLYLVALGDDESRRWAVLDETGAVVDRREDVRDVASIVAMCELAEELAGREATALRVATPALLDEIGASAAALGASFSDAIRGATGVVDDFVEDVQRHYLLPLP